LSGLWRLYGRQRGRVTLFSADFKECSTPQGEQVCDIPASIAFG
jgi:hypothetical protein